LRRTQARYSFKGGDWFGAVGLVMPSFQEWAKDDTILDSRARENSTLQEQAGGNLRKPKRLGDQVYTQILEQIISQGWPEETKLPTESDYAREFGVSRPVVRDALAKLRDDGVIYSRQGAGSFIKRQPGPRIQQFAPLASIADVSRCFEFRIAIERNAARFAALRHDETTLRGIESALNRLEEVIAQGELGADADFQFHLSVAKASDNHFFAEALEGLHRQMEFGMNLNRNLTLLHSEKRLRLVQDEHIAIYDAIAAGNADLADSKMAGHIRNARKRVFEGKS